MKNLFSLLLLTVLQINTHVSHAEMMYEKVEHPLSMRCSLEICSFPPENEIILFGGASGAKNNNDIWKFQNNEWKNKNVSDVNPNGKSGYGMCYNGSVLLVFGGYDDFASLGKSDELWSFDGDGWNLLIPETTKPAPRNGCAMAYDFSRERLVLFGGRGEEFVYLDDTWEWDGSDWHLMDPETSPTPRDNARMVYFELLNSVVMFGGLSSGGLSDNKLWQWDGLEWNILPTGEDEPPSVVGHQIVYDPKHQYLVLYGGYTLYGAIQNVWTWDGFDWTKIQVTGEIPERREYFGMTYDPDRDGIVLFGGLVSVGVYLNDTWIFKDGQWTQIEPEHPSPCYRLESVMAYDSFRDQTVLFGGRTQKGLINDTWMWNGSYWSQVNSDHSPPITTFSKMVFDENHNQFVMALIFDDEFKTWELNGTNWEESGSIQPSLGEGYSLVYDSVRELTVMFGGSEYNDRDSPATNNLWEWDGETWTLIEPNTSFPEPRVYHEATFDIDRDRMVVFGGYIDYGNNYFDMTNETWEWDGSHWYHMEPQGSEPGRRTGHAMVYDNLRRRTILYGGGGYSRPLYSDTWEWDGVQWREVTPETGPGEKIVHAMAYDSRRHRTIIFGGEGTDYSNDTWAYYNADTECCDTLGVTLDLSQTEFHPGDPFACTATVCNNTGAELPDMPLFVLLEVMGHYYFGPTFSESVDTYLDGNPTYPENETEVDVIPPFTWPEGAGSFHGAYFHAALTDPDMTFLYGAMDSVEFGWE